MVKMRIYKIKKLQNNIFAAFFILIIACINRFCRPVKQAIRFYYFKIVDKHIIFSAIQMYKFFIFVSLKMQYFFNNQKLVFFSANQNSTESPFYGLFALKKNLNIFQHG